jgi:hypothetical protein
MENYMSRSQKEKLPTAIGSNNHHDAMLNRESDAQEQQNR